MAFPAQNEFVDMIEAVASARVELASAAMRAGLAERERALSAYRGIVEATTADLINFMSAGHDVDPESLIEQFQQDERKTVAAMQDLREQVASALKSYKRSRPETLPVLNDLLALGLKQLGAEARLPHTAH